MGIDENLRGTKIICCSCEKREGVNELKQIGFLCEECYKEWVSPSGKGIWIPNPKGMKKVKEGHSGEVFMFGPDAM